MRLAFTAIFTFLFLSALPAFSQDTLPTYDNNSLTPNEIPDEDPTPLSDETYAQSGQNIYELNHNVLPDFDNRPAPQNLLPNEPDPVPDPNVMPDYVPDTVPQIQQIEGQTSPND